MAWPLPTNQLWQKQHLATVVHASLASPTDPIGPTVLVAAYHPSAVNPAPMAVEGARDGAVEEVAALDPTTESFECMAGDPAEVQIARVEAETMMVGADTASEVAW